MFLVASMWLELEDIFIIQMTTVMSSYPGQTYYLF